MLTYNFIKKNKVINYIIERFYKVTKIEHQPVFNILIKIIFKLQNTDKLFFETHIFEIANLNFPVITKLIIEYSILHSDTNENVHYFSNLLEILIDTHEKELNKKKNESEDYYKVLLYSLIIQHLNKIKTIDYIEFLQKYDENNLIYNSTLLAIANDAPNLETKLCDNILFKFKNHTSINKIFNWSRWFIPYIGNSDENITYLEEIFFEDQRLYLQKYVELSPETESESLILKCYAKSFSRLNLTTQKKTLLYFYDLFTDKMFISKYPEFSKPLLLTYLKNIKPSKILTNFDKEFFIATPLATKYLLNFINSECIFDDTVLKIYFELCLIRNKISLITSQLERIADSHGLFLHDVMLPICIDEYKEAISLLALKHINATSNKDKIEGAHLLYILFRLGLQKTTHINEIEALFMDKKLKEIRSWVIEIYPYCEYNTEQDVDQIIKICLSNINEKDPNLSNKSILSYLRFIYSCRIDLSHRKDEILKYLFYKPEYDYTGVRIKLINRIIMSYSTKNIDTAFYLFYNLITSDQLKQYNTSKQNQTRYELHNGCLHICKNINNYNLSKLTNVLYDTNCRYAYLILECITYYKDKLAIIKDELEKIKSNENILPCIKDYIHTLNQSKFKEIKSDKWEELLSYL
jgi:hypothetical protein